MLQNNDDIPLSFTVNYPKRGFIWNLHTNVTNKIVTNKNVTNKNVSGSFFIIFFDPFCNFSPLVFSSYFFEISRINVDV